MNHFRKKSISSGSRYDDASMSLASASDKDGKASCDDCLKQKKGPLKQPASNLQILCENEVSAIT